MALKKSWGESATPDLPGLVAVLHEPDVRTNIHLNSKGVPRYVYWNKEKLFDGKNRS
jgi:hypothetical protein